MCAKRKVRKAASSESRSRRSSASLDQVAKKSMPKWRVVNESSYDEDSPSEVDTVSPNLIKNKRSSSFAVKSGTKAKTAFLRAKTKSGKKLSGLVNMAPADARLDAKTQVIEHDEHSAGQG